MQSETLTIPAFQAFARRGPVDCSRILGIEYVTYNKYKRKGVPRSVQFHMYALMQLPRETFETIADHRIEFMKGPRIVGLSQALNSWRQ